MEKEQLREMHTSYWEKVKDVLPNNLKASFLEISPVRQAYNNFNESLTGARIDMGFSDAEIPTSMRNVTIQGQGFYISFGGILIPDVCLGDNEFATRYALVHEQIHEVLRSKALIYGLNGVFDSQYPEIAKVLDGFTEFMAHGYASEVMACEGATLEDCVRAPVTIYDKRMREFLKIEDPGRDVEEEIKATSDQYRKYMGEIKSYDPITQFELCFEKFVQGYIAQETIDLCWSGLATLSKSSLSISRRVVDGNWEYIFPAVMSK